MFSGQRMMTSYIRIGGLALEPPRGWQKAVGKFIDAFPTPRSTSTKICSTQTPSSCERAKGVGHMPLEELLDFGVTGPMLRAAGLTWDIRKSEPYSSYEKFDFEVPVYRRAMSTRGTRCAWRRCARARRIVQQALDGMPEGRWIADAPKVVLPDREKMKTQMEALIYHFKIVTEGVPRAAGRGLRADRESPRGEIGYYVVSDGTAKPYRVLMRTPSFGNLQALSPMFEGSLIADSVASLGSMDFVLGDVDR